MADTYSLAEALRMAEQIERNGEQFYTQAAAATKDASVRQLFEHLAGEEKKHEKYFAELRKQFCQRDDIHLVDVDGTVEAYIRAAADTHVFNLNKDVSKLLASVQSSLSTVELALGFEKDTIAYFTAIKGAIKDQNKPKVEIMIQEEVDHIRQLHEIMKSLSE